MHPYERSWEEKNKNKNKHACEEQGYANLQSPNSKSLRLGCNAEDEPMLKREAEFSSHTVALPLLSLSGAAHCQNAARAVWRDTHTHTHTQTQTHTHTHTHSPTPLLPTRAAESAARQEHFPSSDSSEVPMS